MWREIVKILRTNVRRSKNPFCDPTSHSTIYLRPKYVIWECLTYSNKRVTEKYAGANPRFRLHPPINLETSETLSEPVDSRCTNRRGWKKNSDPVKVVHFFAMSFNGFKVDPQVRLEFCPVDELSAFSTLLFPSLLTVFSEILRVREILFLVGGSYTCRQHWERRRTVFVCILPSQRLFEGYRHERENARSPLLRYLESTCRCKNSNVVGHVHFLGQQGQAVKPGRIAQRWTWRLVRPAAILK